MSSLAFDTRAEDSSPSLHAGPFADWLMRTRAALRGDGGVEVACGDCIGCCSSAYPVPLRSQDSVVLTEIPLQFIVHAHGRMMITSREDGTCPMLVDRKCSIYERRPQACRDYDCRVFAAAGIDAGGQTRSLINQRVRSWRFSYPTANDERAHRAVRAAAAFIRDHPDSFPGRAPTAPTGIAVLAIKVYALFLEDRVAQMSPPQIAREVIRASREFDLDGARS